MATPAQATAGKTIITITEGQPVPKSATVNVESTLQFVNKDDIDYRIWGLPIGRYLGTDILLPALGGVSVFVDRETKKGTFNYELFQTNLQNRLILATRGTIPADSGGGGQIIVDP